MKAQTLRTVGLAAFAASSIAFGGHLAGAQQSTPSASPSASPTAVTCERDDSVAAGELRRGEQYQSDAKVTLDDAIATAKAEATGDLGSVDLEMDDGQLVYEVEIGQHDVLVDATTGEVIAVEQNDDCYAMIGDVRFEDEDGLLSTVAVTPEQAIETARGEIDGTVRSVELEDEDGQVVYTVETDGEEVTIDAQSGEVITVDQRDDDHDENDDRDHEDGHDHEDNDHEEGDDD